MTHSNSQHWIIIPVHNRRETTRNCLGNLFQIIHPEQFTICVVDDGSTDGTGEMLQSDFPQVIRLEGSGDLYWGGGIRMGMEYAYDQQAQTLIWLNDDCQPDAGALENLVERVTQTHGICGGICRDPDHPTQVTYSGIKKGFTRDPGSVRHDDPPDPELKRPNLDHLVRCEPGSYHPADMLNGNMVAVHRSVVDKIGMMPAAQFPHYGGDKVYSLRANHAGITVEISGSATARNRRDYPNEQFGVQKPASALLREPWRVGSPYYFPFYVRFTREVFGPIAYLRLPMYFVNLSRNFLTALRRAKQQQNQVKNS